MNNGWGACSDPRKTAAVACARRREFFCVAHAAGAACPAGRLGGDGTNTYDAASNTYTAAAAQTGAGLQKWVFNNGTWTLAYTLQAGLNLGVPYPVKGYPTGINAATNLPWSAATDGLRNITGRVNRDGTVTIWAITSTVSGSGDQGADPNKLVMITDKLAATTLPADESFVTARTARFGEAVRGVSFTPGTGLDTD